MQIGIGGAAGDAYDPLRQYLPNPALGPHDPTTAVALAALVLIKDKGAPTGQPIDAYLPYARAYNGTGPAADAYAARVIADAHAYQGSGQTTLVSGTTRLRGRGEQRRVRQPIRARPGHAITHRPRRRLQRHRPDRRARPRPRRPRQHHRLRLGQRRRLDLLPAHRRRLRRRLHLRRRRHHADRPHRPTRHPGPADRHLQRPLNRDRLRARPRRPRPRPQRLPRRSGHRRGADNEPAPPVPRRAERPSRPDKLRRGMPHCRGSDPEHARRAPAMSTSSSSIAHPETPQRGRRTLPTWPSISVVGARSQTRPNRGEARANEQARHFRRTARMFLGARSSQKSAVLRRPRTSAWSGVGMNSEMICYI